MNCSKCGCVLKRTDTHCPICGLEVPKIENDDYGKFEMPPVYEKRSSRNKPAKVSEKDAARETAATVDTAEYEDVKEKGSGAKRFFIGLLIAILIIGAAAFAMYFAYNYFMKDMKGEYSTQIVKYDSRVNKVNSDMAEVIKKGGGALPVDGILAQLKTTYNSLNSISQDLGSIAPPSMFASSHNKLVEAVKLNKLMYQELETILDKPADPDIQKTLDTFSEDLEKCVNDYLSVDIKDTDFIIPDEIQNLPAMITPWVQQKQKEYSQVSTLIASFTKYFGDISALLVTYETSRTDMSQALRTARTDRTSWDQFYTILDKNEGIVKGVKESYDKLQVPSQLKTFNKDFAVILDDNLSYFEKLRLAAKADQEFVKDLLPPEEVTKKTAEIEAMYQDAEKINTTVVTNYQKYTADVSVQKDKFMNPDYVLSLIKGKK